MKVSRHSDTTIDVKRNIVMFHTCLVIDAAKRPVAVCITTNPLEHRAYAQVVMHKTRSHSCAVQVARYVRRTFGIEAPVTTHRATRPVELMIGYAAARGMQYPPQSDTPWHPVVLHIAATPIATLLHEVAGGHNAARTRYVVYGVRFYSTPEGTKEYRGVTHKFDSLERRYREAPPDKFGFVAFVQVARCATQEEADAKRVGFEPAGDHLWTRKPDPEYVRRILRIDVHGDIVWTCDDTSAVRSYDFDAVVIGPHVYTKFQIEMVLKHGAWPPKAHSLEGMRLQFTGSMG